MSFAIPDGLAPETYPLAWLLGTWRGPGFLGYPGIEERPILVEATYTSDGGPYLAYTCTTWLLENPPASLEGEIDVAAMTAGEVWATESGYWRVPPQGGDADAEPAHDEPGAAAGTRGTPGTNGAAHASGATTPPRTELEVLLSEPTGHASVYLGVVQGPRITLATDLIARTATGAEVTAARRMYGMVNSELMWATDMAAFGHEMQSYSSGRLQRQS
ncbi:FABP family protein [Ruania halotolerans]|uniref:FABP family protein n=1 Tax=Ruania halotolerans TaxID=2897773 RepID=UPI001E5E19D8|nr:FABP family protein [Ruania halotolerans]UFU05921.1 FABP family protein [Ruania halotolerans]